MLWYYECLDPDSKATVYCISLLWYLHMSVAKTFTITIKICNISYMCTHKHKCDMPKCFLKFRIEKLSRFKNDKSFIQFLFISIVIFYNFNQIDFLFGAVGHHAECHAGRVNKFVREHV